MNNYSLPIRTWEALDHAVAELDKRVGKVEARLDLILILMGYVTLATTAIVGIAITALLGG